MAVERQSTGVRGFDIVLNGGLVPNRSYVLHGEAGTGKTVLGLRFLEAGTERDQTGLFVHCSETADELREKANAVDIDADALSFLDLRAEQAESGGQRDTFAGNADDDELVGRLADRIDSLSPDRVVVDSSTRLRDLLSSRERFREEVIGLARYLKEDGTTVLFTGRTALNDDLSVVDDAESNSSAPTEHERSSCRSSRKTCERDDTGCEFRTTASPCSPRSTPRFTTAISTPFNSRPGFPKWISYSTVASSGGRSRSSAGRPASERRRSGRSS
ncbi:ATPase domain-containing protein [Haladaptatus sp. R4]|uniref:ATPase domain-containing protein n=1 Tax=Haladaptatus sp. R4 TaxID=1679489 RepID=UPI000AAAD85B|nr:ATPase domain-containing protein [Haladaptatus sp. R4]